MSEPVEEYIQVSKYASRKKCPCGKMLQRLRLVPWQCDCGRIFGRQRSTWQWAHLYLMGWRFSVERLRRNMKVPEGLRTWLDGGEPQ